MSRRRIAVGAVLLLALSVRVVYVAATPHHALGGDAADYDRHAVSLAEGRGYPPSFLPQREAGSTAWRPPLYPLVLAALYRLTGTVAESGRVTLGRLLQAVLGTILVGLLGALALAVWGHRSLALLTMALAALYPPLILWGSTLLTEPLALVLEVAALLAVLAARRRTRPRRWVITAGLLTGLVMLARPNGILLLLPVVAGLWTVRPRLSRRALAAPAVAAVVSIAVLSPWLVRNALVVHRVTTSTAAGFSLAGTYNEASRHHPAWPAVWLFAPAPYASIYLLPISEAEMDRRLRAAALAYIRAHPAYVAEVGFWNTVRFLDLSPSFTRYVMEVEADVPGGLADLERFTFWAIALLALAGAASRFGRSLPRFVWLVPLVMWASSVFVWSSSRYRQPLEPLFVMLAAAGLVGLRERWKAIP